MKSDDISINPDYDLTCADTTVYLPHNNSFAPHELVDDLLQWTKVLMHTILQEHEHPQRTQLDVAVSLYSDITHSILDPRNSLIASTPQDLADDYAITTLTTMIADLSTAMRYLKYVEIDETILEYARLHDIPEIIIKTSDAIDLIAMKNS